MEEINGKNYYTKDEVVRACKEFAKLNPHCKFHNYPFHKVVRRETTEAEREAYQERNGRGSYPAEVTVLSFSKVYADDATPETKGLYIRCSWEEKAIHG